MSGNKELEEGPILDIQYGKRGGLVPAVVQDAVSKDILMLGYANPKALSTTLKEGYATFWSTSRDVLWTKGKTSGDLLRIVDILVDCDQDALVYLVEMLGEGACHTKDKNGKARRSCFYRRITGDGLEHLEGMQ